MEDRKVLSPEMIALYNSLIATVSTTSCKTSDLFRPLIILARNLNDKDLERWAKLEMEGYSTHNPIFADDKIPYYRKIRALKCNGWGYSLNPEYVPYEMWEGVTELEQFLKRDIVLYRDYQGKEQSLFSDDHHWSVSPKDILPILNLIESQVLEKLLDLQPFIEASRMQNVGEVIDMTNPISQLERICFKFHEISKQLDVARYSNRERLLINDEYDLQYLIYGLLRLYFDDVRKEEWNSSFAGKSTRIDFLLINESIAFETKFASDNHNEKRIGEELIEDVYYYKQNPKCKTLVAFIYDPNRVIKNRPSLTVDISKAENGFAKVFIYP